MSVCVCVSGDDQARERVDCRPVFVCLSVCVSVSMSVYLSVVCQVMTKHEKEMIVDLRKCNFNELAQYYKMKAEERKNMSKEEKQVQLCCCLTALEKQVQFFSSSLTSQLTPC